MSRFHRAEANVTRYGMVHEFYADAEAADRLEAALAAMRSEPTPQDPDGRRRVAYTTAVAVLICRLSDTQASGESWTAQGTIARRLRINRDTVRLADQAIVSARLMVDTKRKHQGAVRYQMLPDRFPMPDYSGMGPVDNPEPMPDAMPDAMPEYSGTTSTGSWDRPASSPTTSDSSSAPPAWAAPPSDPPPADDDEALIALENLPGHPRATDAIRRLIAAACEQQGHTATTVNSYLRAGMTGNVTNPAGLVTSLLREIPTHYAPPPLAPVLDWCGQCDEIDRWITVPDPNDPDEPLYADKCPNCHPGRVESRARITNPSAAPEAVAARSMLRDPTTPARYAT